MDVPRTNDAHWQVNISQKTERERERQRRERRERERERERAKSRKEDDQILFLYISNLISYKEAYLGPYCL